MNQLAKDIDVPPLSQQPVPGIVNIPLPEANQLSDWTLSDKISKDIDIAHLRRWPKRRMTKLSRFWLPLTSPGLKLLMMYRINHSLYAKRELGGWRGMLWRLVSIPFKPLSLAIKISSKSEINTHSEIEGGVYFSDLGHIILGTRKTGAGTVIGTRVTIGVNHVNNGRPEIGRNVWIGSDCVVFGPITIGDGATLLPGTVLAKSIPENVVVHGNPARLLMKNFDNSELRADLAINAEQYVNSKRLGG
jgi:serine acetyltransferase